MVCSQKCSHLTLIAAFIEINVVESDGKCVEMVVCEITYDGRNDGRIETTTQIGSHLNVRAQANPYGVDQQIGQFLLKTLLFPLGVNACWHLRCIGKRNPPVVFNADL